MNNKFTLIFGGSGFIGQHLANKLGSSYLNLDIVSTEKNHQYCDVRNPIDIKSEKYINVETNGAMEPDDAIAMSARILQEQLQYFINFEEPEIDVATKEEESEIKFNRKRF